MNPEQRLQANLVVARALYKWADIFCDEKVSVPDDRGGLKVFDIFTTPEDCHRAVRYLKNKHQISILITKNAPHNWVAEYPDGTTVTVCEGLELYQSAVAAAYITLRS